jgi:dTDP-L-rhamnose 4-epimerase
MALGRLFPTIATAVERPIPGEVINIGSGNPISVLEIAEILTHEMKKSISPRVVKRYRQGDIRHCFADISKARRLLKWQPTRIFRQGVSELVHWVKSQRDVSDRVDSAWKELEQRGLLS